MSVINLRAGRIALKYPLHTQQHIFQVVKRRKKSDSTPSGNGNKSLKEDVRTVPTPNTVPPLPLSQRLGPLSKIFSAYGRAQRTRPHVTQLCSSLAIYFCGDLCAQNVGDEDYDLWRTLRHLIIGGTCSIPSYRWFMYLGQSFNYGSKMLSLSAKVVVNQIVFTPIFNSYFFGMQSLLVGEGLTGAWERIQNTVPVSIINSCKLWPAVTAFNFTYISPQYRAVFAGFVAIGWQSYLSWLNQRAAREELVRRSALDTSAVEVRRP